MSDTTIRHGRIEDADAVAELWREAFGSTSDDVTRGVRIAGWDNALIAERGGEVAGVTLGIPMGQWFGGRSVSCVGIAGVAVGSLHRRCGVGIALMRAAVQRMYDDGVALSSLYPAVQPLYRAVGYELAGDRWRIEIELDRLNVRADSPRLRVARADDMEAIAGAYAEIASHGTGDLDRPPYIWARTRGTEKVRVDEFVVEEAGEVTGWIRYHVGKNREGRRVIVVYDVGARTAPAARRILSHFSDQALQMHAVRWTGVAEDPLLAHLPDQTWTMRQADSWMLRIVHVEKALTDRGYGAGVSGELHLEISDELFPANSGRYVLRVEGGCGTVERGGDGHLRMTERGLAPLYSGHRTPYQLRVAGLLEAADEHLSAAQSIFAGPPCAMRDGF